MYASVRREGEHLIWEGADTPRGYGKMSIGTEIVYSHRNECVEPGHLIAKQKKKAKPA